MRMDTTTQAGPGFPAVTAWSVIVGARDRTSPDWEKHLDALVRRYWKPVCRYLIRRWNCSAEDAADLTQEFFGRLYESNFIEGAAPERGRFRTFLKLKLRDLVVDDLRRKTALKRGGAAGIVSIDALDDQRSRQPAWKGLSPEDEFDRLWAIELLDAAVAKLEEVVRAEGTPQLFQAFHRCTLSEPPQSYQECADALGVRVRDVGHYVFRAKIKLRKIIQDLVREVVEKEEEVTDEVAHLLSLLRLSP
jgi:RNA polymerase sigma factor (sigma-70 family)